MRKEIYVYCSVNISSMPSVSSAVRLSTNSWIPALTIMQHPSSQTSAAKTKKELNESKEVNKRHQQPSNWIQKGTS